MSSAGQSPGGFDAKKFDALFSSRMGTQGQAPAEMAAAEPVGGGAANGGSSDTGSEPAPNDGPAPGGSIVNEGPMGQEAPAGASPSAGSPSAAPGQTDKPGLFKRLLTAISHPGDIAEGLTTGLIRAPGEAVGGALDTVKDVAGDKAAKTAAELLPFGMGSLAAYLVTQSPNHNASYADIMSARQILGKVGNNSVNQATANIAGIAMGMAALPEAEVPEAWGYFGKAAEWAQNSLRFGTSAGIVSGPNDERFSNALQALGVHTEFTDWLAAHNTAPAENRFKNALDGVVGGAAFDTVFQTAKWVRSIIKGAPDVAARDAANEAAKEAVPEVGHPNEIVTKAVKRGEGPQPAANDDNPGVATEEGKDAVADHLTDQVKGQAQDAVNAEGEEDNKPAVKFFVKGAGKADGEYRPVGEFDKEDLSRFYEQAGRWKGTSSEDLDITEEQAPDTHAGVGTWKFSTFQTPDDVAPFMRALIDNAPAIERPMKDADRQQIIAATSKELGLDPSAAEAFLGGIAKDTKSLDIAAGTARTLWAGIVNKITQNAYRGIEGLSDADLKEHLNDLATATNWGAHLTDIKAGLGRGLRSWGLPPADEYQKLFGKPEAESVIPTAAESPLPSLPRNLSELQDFYELWKATGGDRSAMADLLQGKVTAPDSWQYLRNSMPNFYTGSLLAGKAIVKGFLMPAFLGTLRTFEKTAGGSIAALNPALSADERSALLATAVNAPRAYFATIAQMVSASRYMLQAIKQGGQSVIGGGYSAKDAAQRLGPLTDQLLHAMNAEPNWRYSLGNLINFWPRQVFSLVGGHDEFTKRLSYYGETYVSAAAEAAQRGLEGDEAQQFVHDKLSSSIDPVTGAATDEDMLNQAARTSLIQAHSAGPMGQLITALDSARNQYPELRYILPVLDVPANALGEALRRIPVANFFMKETRDDLNGLNGPVSKAEAYGRMLTGGSVLGTGFALARSGQLTGAGPDDFRARQVWLRDHQPYSFKLPGVGWVSYKDWEPVGGLLGFVGELYDHTVYESSEKAWSDKMLTGVGAVAEYIKDKGALQQFSDLLNFGGDPKQSPAMLTRLLGSTAAGFVPAFVKYGRNLSDEDERSKVGNGFVEGIGKYMMDAIPGQSKKLDPLRNILGEPVHVPNDTLLENMLPVTYSPVHPESEDIVDRELDRIYQQTGYAPGVTGQTDLLHGFQDARALKLEDGRSLYDHFMGNRLEGLIDNDAGDGKMNAREYLKQLFESDDYKAAQYGSPSAAQDILGETSKLKMVSDVFRQINEASKQKVAQDSPTAARYLAAAQIKRTSPDLFGGRSLNDIAHGEPLLRSLGIDIQEYEAAQRGE